MFPAMHTHPTDTHAGGADRKKKKECREGDEREVIIQSKRQGWCYKNTRKGPEGFGLRTSKGRQVQDEDLLADPNITHNKIT